MYFIVLPASFLPYCVKRYHPWSFQWNSVRQICTTLATNNVPLFPDGGSDRVTCSGWQSQPFCFWVGMQNNFLPPAFLSFGDSPPQSTTLCIRQALKILEWGWILSLGHNPNLVDSLERERNLQISLGLLIQAFYCRSEQGPVCLCAFYRVDPLASIFMFRSLSESWYMLLYVFISPKNGGDRKDIKAVSGFEELIVFL